MTEVRKVSSLHAVCRSAVLDAINNHSEADLALTNALDIADHAASEIVEWVLKHYAGEPTAAEARTRVHAPPQHLVGECLARSHGRLRESKETPA